MTGSAEPPSEPGGTGLKGMADRATALGGRHCALPRWGGTWCERHSPAALGKLVTELDTVAPLAGANSAAEGTLDAMSLRGFDQQVDADGIAANAAGDLLKREPHPEGLAILILPVAKNRARRSPVVPEVNRAAAPAAKHCE